MKINVHSLRVFNFMVVSALLFLASPLKAYQNTDSQFNERLKSYVNSLLTRSGEKDIEKERYLVQQLRMVNEEIKARVGNVSEKRQHYFDRLQKRLSEIKDLKNRIPSTAGGQIFNFIADLEQRIQKTIDAGVMDYKRQKVFDDATQLLYLAEELIKLDPGTNLSANDQIAQGIARANKKFNVGTSGKTVKKTLSKAGTPSTVFDVYQEWLKTKRLTYMVRLTDVEVLKRKLIRKSNISELERMFKRELLHAAQAYNFGYYKLALLSFNEIKKQYKNIGELDDVQYYIANCNYIIGRYLEAKTEFDNLINEYPSSTYLSDGYLKLIELSNHFEKYADAVNYFHQMQNVVSSTDKKYEGAILQAVNAALNGNMFDEVAALASEVNTRSPIYNYIRYVEAEALAGAGNYDEAADLFSSVLKVKSLSPEFRFDILAKLGYIQYNIGQPDRSIDYYTQIGSNYSRYDRVLVAFGWAYYKKEINKKRIAERNFLKAKKSLEVLIDNFPNSEYFLEAKTLLGYINQLEYNTTSAISNFSYVFKAKDVKDLSDQLNEQESELEKVRKTATSLEKKALRKNNPDAYNRAVAMENTVKYPLQRLKYMDISPVGVAATNEVARLKSQLNVLARLKEKAKSKKDQAVVDRIETLETKIYRAINTTTVQKSSPLGFNYFDEHPLARKESVVENENKKILKMRQDARVQREELSKQLSMLDIEIANAKSRRDYKKLVNLEISKSRFKGIAQNMDYLESWMYSLKTKKTHINLNRWSDYGAFGMANVNFAVRNQQKKQLGEFRDQVQKINQLLMDRKENVEHKISRIQDEITLMTRRVRKQERIREREELNRQFEESYFDTHESENKNQSQEDSNTTVPPKLNDDSDQ